MVDALAVHRQPIIDALALACDAARDRGVNAWGDDLADRLFAFASRGKLLRGSFVAGGCDAFGAPPSDAAYRVGAAMELIQSFLLIHDDIMDQDAIRRGHPAVYEQYRRVGAERGYAGPDRFGESMGICAGDVAMLLAFQTICALDVPADVRCAVADSVAREIADVGVAQMGDVAHGHATEPVSEDDILSVYRYKTGRYTFSLPLMTGGLLAGAPAESLERVGEWGELQGIVFQIRDDQLGLIGESHEIGKPAGSDIRSNKQTLHRLLLLERVADSPYADVASLFGKQDLGDADIARVREAIGETGVIDTLDRRIAEIRARANALIGALDGLTRPGYDLLLSIDRYNADRTV